MRIVTYSELSNRELIDETIRAARAERQSTSTLIALLAELDARRLYLAEGCPSLFRYCTQVLHLSEHAAYHRIEAARAVRRYPVILDMLTEGEVTLTTIALLRPHLTDDNHRPLLMAARHLSKRDVERQIASLAPQPDTKPLVRRLTPSTMTPISGPETSEPGLLQKSGSVAPLEPGATHVPPQAATSAARKSTSAQDAERYLLKVTISGGTHAKLRRAQDLLRHAIPNGDPAEVLDRALSMLVQHLERRKLAAAARPRPVGRPARRRPGQAASRHIPAAIRRAVWARDQGRCAFVGSHGRCNETGWLEFHHIVPFAAGGKTTIENMALRCRAHNKYESEMRFGPLDRHIPPPPPRVVRT